MFKNKPRKIEDDIRLYYRHYKQVSKKLVQRRQLDKYTQCSWFLEGLPGKIKERLVRKLKINPDDIVTIN